MVKSYTIHKLAGICGGIFLFLLAITGFFLDHDNWKFLYKSTFKTSSKTLLKLDNRLLKSYYIDKSDPKHIVVASLRGVYESYNKGLDFKKTLNEPSVSIKSNNNGLFLATFDGIYKLTKFGWKSFLLKGKHITSLAVYKNIAFCAENKKFLYILDLKNRKVLNKTTVNIDKNQLNHDITLSRLVRDVHYGRGIFDDGISLLLNDFAAITMVILSISGYLIWYFIKNKKLAKFCRKTIKFHANIFIISLSIFMMILAVSGIFLDHAKSLRNFMSSIQIQNKILPPIYHSLKEDIWSVDFDGKTYRIGNRYGIYKSKDLKSWKLENIGFAYKMIRKGNILYISGMGAPNRICKNDKYTLLPHTPHMFRSVILKNNTLEFIPSKNAKMPMPNYNSITLFTLILAIHNGSIFAPWWIWINDFAAILLIILFITGIYRWSKKKAYKTTKLSSKISLSF